MSKTFNELIKEVKEDVYGQQGNALVVLASLNSTVEFTPMLAPNGKVDGTTSQYTIQRRKRPTVNTVSNPNSGSTSDALAALDGFSKNDWVSINVATGDLMSVGFKSTFNDDYDFGENPQHTKDAMYQVGEIALARKAKLLAELDTATEAAILQDYVKGELAVWDAIADQVLALGQVEDRFKTKQDLSSFVIIVDAFTAKNLSKEMGKEFRQEAAIAETGFTTSRSVNGTPVIVDSTLPKYTGYILHKEALGFKSQPIEKTVSIDLGLTEYTGTFFYDVQKLIDTDRAVKLVVNPSPAPAPTIDEDE